MLQPLNRYLVVEPKEDAAPETAHILIPDDARVDNSKFKLVTLKAAHIESRLEKGSQLLVLSHMIEEAEFSGKKYYLVLENHVVGFLPRE